MSHQEFSISEVFESAVTIVRNLPKEGPFKPSDELKLKFYAYFKQATHGPNDTPKPRFYQIVEAYKWDAWQKLGQMAKEEAMRAYISELKEVMNSIPREETSESDNELFEGILGKKFYDYWFKEWQAEPREQQVGAGSAETMTQSQLVGAGNRLRANVNRNSAHDTQTGRESSSGGSSVSLLEDTSQAPTAAAANACAAAGSGEPELAGYSTPTSLEELPATIGGQLSDQFALAVLRLQHGLEETNTRLSRLEEQLRQSMSSIRSLEARQEQTQPKQVAGGSGAGRSRSPRGRLLGSLLARVDTVHWFYLSYPIVVYALLRLLFDRGARRRGEPRR